MNLSFCGCGFLGMYHIGSIRALLKHGRTFLDSVERVGGASAGALAATMFLCAPDKLQACKHFNLDLADQVRRKPLGAFTPNFNLIDPIREFIRASLPPLSYQKADGVLHISLTTFPKYRLPENKIVKNYTSDRDLEEVLLASCFIPVYAGVKLPILYNKFHTDGGLTNNLIVFDTGRTVTVSPFCGDQDICPVDPRGRALFVHVKNQQFRFNAQNGIRAIHGMFPPARDILLKYYEAGYNDTLKFLRKEKCFEN